MTRPALSIVSAAALLAFASGCSARAEKATLPEAGAAARAVRTVKPAQRVETGLSRATGTLRARHEAVLAARMTGQIHRIRVQVGDRVKAGQPLVEMDASTVRIGLQNARAMERLATARLAEADREVERGRQLFEAQGLPQSAWDQVRTGREIAAAQLDQARAAVKMAEQQLADATITAPFAGVVTGKFQNAGNTVTLMPISPILALTDVDALEAKLALPEALDPFVEVGQTVEGTTTPGGRTFQAKVRVKAGVVDPMTRTIEVLADVLDPAGLLPGTIVTADLGRYGEDGRLFLPSTAVRTDGKSSWVFVVAAGKAEKREVVVAAVHPGTVAVKEGLDAGSEVVVDPGALAAGDAVVALSK